MVKKVIYSCFIMGIHLTAVKCHWDLIPATRHKWTHPHHNPSQTGRYLIYLRQRDGRLSWSSPMSVNFLVAKLLHGVVSFELSYFWLRADWRNAWSTCKLSALKHDVQNTNLFLQIFPVYSVLLRLISVIHFYMLTEAVIYKTWQRPSKIY